MDSRFWRQSSWRRRRRAGSARRPRCSTSGGARPSASTSDSILFFPDAAGELLDRVFVKIDVERLRGTTLRKPPRSTA
jgi:hypothetical protein